MLKVKLLLILVLAFAIPVMSMEKPTDEGYQLELIELQMAPVLPDVTKPVISQRSLSVSGDASSILCTKELSMKSPVQPYPSGLVIASAPFEVGWQYTETI